MTPWTDLDLWKLKSLIEIGKSASQAGKLMDRSPKACREAALRNNLGNFKAKSGVLKRDIPKDFKEHAPYMSYAEMQERYGAGVSTITNWLRDTGISKAKLRKPKRTTVSKADKHFAPVDRYQHDDSELGLAVEFLRTLGPIIRCGTDGRYNERGTMWRRGNTLLTGAEILERAASNKRRERR